MEGVHENMKKAFVLAAALMLFAGVASAQYSIELDLDATTGNGPDFLSTAPGPVAIDVWVQGNGLLYSANLTLQHAGPASYVSYVYATAFTNTPPQVTGNDVLVQSTDFTFVGAVAPFLHGTANYNYDGPTGIATVATVQLNGWLDGNFISGVFTNNVDCSFGLDVVGTEEASWGQVKNLFR